MGEVPPKQALKEREREFVCHISQSGSGSNFYGDLISGFNLAKVNLSEINEAWVVCKDNCQNSEIVLENVKKPNLICKNPKSCEGMKVSYFIEPPETSEYPIVSCGADHSCSNLMVVDSHHDRVDRNVIQCSDYLATNCFQTAF